MHLLKYTHLKSSSLSVRCTPRMLVLLNLILTLVICDQFDDFYRYTFTAEAGGTDLGLYLTLSTSEDPVTKQPVNHLSLDKFSFAMRFFYYNQTKNQVTSIFEQKNHNLVATFTDQGVGIFDNSPSKFVGIDNNLLSFNGSTDKFIACSEDLRSYFLYFDPKTYNTSECMNVNLRGRSEGLVFPSVSEEAEKGPYYNLSLRIQSNISELQENTITPMSVRRQLISICGVTGNYISTSMPSFVYNEVSKTVHFNSVYNNDFPLTLRVDGHRVGLGLCNSNLVQMVDGYLSYNGSKDFTIYKFKESVKSGNYEISLSNTHPNVDCVTVQIAGRLYRKVSPNDPSFNGQISQFHVSDVDDGCSPLTGNHTMSSAVLSLSSTSSSTSKVKTKSSTKKTGSQSRSKSGNIACSASCNLINFILVAVFNLLI